MSCDAAEFILTKIKNNAIISILSSIFMQIKTRQWTNSMSLVYYRKDEHFVSLIQKVFKIAFWTCWHISQLICVFIEVRFSYNEVDLSRNLIEWLKFPHFTYHCKIMIINHGPFKLTRTLHGRVCVSVYGSAHRPATGPRRDRSFLSVEFFPSSQ